VPEVAGEDTKLNVYVGLSLSENFNGFDLIVVNFL
jgi:hypothetical protein